MFFSKKVVPLRGKNRTKVGCIRKKPNNDLFFSLFCTTFAPTFETIHNIIIR